MGFAPGPPPQFRPQPPPAPPSKVVEVESFEFVSCHGSLSRVRINGDLYWVDSGGNVTIDGRKKPGVLFSGISRSMVLSQTTTQEPAPVTGDVPGPRAIRLRGPDA